MSSMFSFIDRVKSFKFAFVGIFTMLKTQHNSWIHLLATVIVIGAGLFFRVSLVECCLLVIAVMAVWVAEAFNTSLEFLSDAVSTEFHPLVKKVKDVAAGAVLISAIGATIVGLLIFTPYLMVLIKN